MFNEHPGRQSGGTQVALLTAASSRTWQGSQAPAAPYTPQDTAPTQACQSHQPRLPSLSTSNLPCQYRSGITFALICGDLSRRYILSVQIRIVISYLPTAWAYSAAPRTGYRRCGSTPPPLAYLAAANPVVCKK